MNSKDYYDKYAWNDAMILDKIQEILEDKNIDDLEFSQEELENIKLQLDSSLSSEELNESLSLVAKNIDELKVLPNEDIKDYISRLINYLNDTNINCIIGEFEGIDFEVYHNSNIDDVFNDYYDKYDKTYGISEMLSDLGFIKK